MPCQECQSAGIQVRKPLVLPLRSLPSQRRINPWRRAPPGSWDAPLGKPASVALGVGPVARHTGRRSSHPRSRLRRWELTEQEVAGWLSRLCPLRPGARTHNSAFPVLALGIGWPVLSALTTPEHSVRNLRIGPSCARFCSYERTRESPSPER